MANITQDMRFRLSLIRYGEKHGVSQTTRKYKTNRQYVYRQKNRYDVSWESLRDRSRRPHHHPNEHTPGKLQLICDMHRRNPHAGPVIIQIKLRQRGYSRSITGIYRVLRRWNLVPAKPPTPKYISKPYEQMMYPRQRIQIDVKHVPSSYIIGDAAGQQFYQYTAIDEFSRFRYLEAFEECNTYTSAVFPEHTLNAFPFGVEYVQIDNGMEFTNRFSYRASEGNIFLFEKRLSELGIIHKKIRPFTPRHNGKVEHTHQ